MKRIVRLIDTISAAAGGVAGVLLCLGLGLTAGEILLRSVFSRTLFITEEYSGYLMCGLTFCGLAYTLKERGHIRMTLVHGLVKGRSRVGLDACCLAVGLLFSAGVTLVTGQLFWDSAVTGSQSMQVSSTYLAIPQAFMPLGALVLTLQFLGELLKSVLILRGDAEGLDIRVEAGDLGR